MAVEVESIPSNQIEPSSVVQQTAFWARVKSKQGVYSRAFRIEADANGLYTDHYRYGDLMKENGDLLIILRNIDRDHHIAYVPYGPTMLPAEDYQGNFLEELSEVIRPSLPESCLLLRYDLNWKSLWAGDDDYYKNGCWTGPPERRIQEMRFNFNTENWNLRKSQTDILPSHTIFMDLNLDDETLLKRMKPKTRYNIRLAKKRGVEVETCGVENIDTWYELYRQTSERNGIRGTDQKCFKNILETRAQDTRSPAEVELLVARLDDEPLAAMFFVNTGKRATYLYGASSNTNRRHMAPYALQWAAIKRAKEKGCKEYDMFGISAIPDPAHPLYGLYRFKSGFGGDIFHRMGCWDYPLQDKYYEQVVAREMNMAGFHL